MPERFNLLGMMARNPVKAKAFESAWNIQTSRTLDELLNGKKPLYAVVSVAKAATAEVLGELSRREIPCLCETPPAPDVAGLDAVNDLARRGADSDRRAIYFSAHARGSAGRRELGSPGKDFPGSGFVHAKLSRDEFDPAVSGSGIRTGEDHGTEI